MVKPTVHDIAKEAGVSLATVDRVLNARAGVREKTIARVNAAIDKIGYVRDIQAANLARRRAYGFVFVIPEGDTLFLATLRQAISDASRAGLHDRISTRVIAVPPRDPHRLVAVLGEVDPATVDGVAIMAPETPHVRDAIARLSDRGIAVCALVSDLPSTRRDHFAGIDNVAAGRTAGQLMGRYLSARGSRPRVLTLTSSLLSRDSIERRLGFGQIMAESFPGIDLLPSVEGHDDPDRIRAILPLVLDGPAPVSGVYSLGAGNRALVDALRERGMATAVTVIAHDLTGHTRGALLDGSIDVVINQDLGHVVRSALRVMRATRDGTVINQGQERIRIDIILKENLPPEAA